MDGRASSLSTSHLVTTVPIFTTSKLLPFTWLRVCRLSSLQRGSGAPETYQFEPLSAMNIPYFFSAFRITRTSGGNGAMVKLDFSRTRIPMGGRFGLVLLLAECR